MRFQNYLNERKESMSDKKTRIQECLHCVAFSVRQDKGKDIDSSDLLDAKLFEDGFRNCKLDTSLHEIYEFANDNPSWVNSIVTSSNAFFNSSYKKSSSYTFHRGSGIMLMIEMEFDKLIKKDNIRLNTDKWNPADIWAVSSGFNSSFNFNSLIEFNSYINEQLEKKNLLGLSLKKTGKNAKVKLIDQSSVEIKPIEFKSIQKPKNPFVTGIVINLSYDRRINVRSFRISHNLPITAEILGKTARHGKASKDVFWKVLRKHNIMQIKLSTIKKMKNESLKFIVTKLWGEIGHNFPQNTINKEYDKLIEKLYDRGRDGYWLSIINALNFGSFLNNNKGVANDIIKDLYYSGLSLGDLSSNFIKIS